MATPHRIRQVCVAAINVAQRLRPLRDALVDELAESIAARGLISPISITYPNGQVSPVLVAGAHRLEAAKLLQWETISCIEVTYESASQLMLIEIDENLVRGDLSQADRGAHTGKRKKLTETLGLALNHGGAPGAGRGKAPKDAKSASLGGFVKETAAKTGKSQRTVAQDAARAEYIPRLEEVIGTSLDQGVELDALMKLKPEQQNALIDKAVAGEKVSAKPEAKRIARAAKEEALGEATRAASAAIGSKLYSVILADPPWRFEPYSRDTGLDRSADNHYPTMAIDAICTLNVPAADNSVLFLWATVPMLPDALSVMAAWGFAYKSHCVWQKDRTGTGYWFRNCHELLLVGTRGTVPAPAPGTQFNSCIAASVGEHSAKPDVFTQMIETLFPSADRLEMFARNTRAGWDTWGNEAS